MMPSTRARLASTHRDTRAAGEMDRRRDRRMTAPMTAVIGATPYAIGDWSLGGLKILDYYGSLSEGDHTGLRVLVPTAGPGALFHANGNVKRKLEEEAIIGVCFDPLDGIAFDTLNRYLRERLLRGGI